MNHVMKSVRCPSYRKHHKYETCGHLLAGVKDGIVYLYCEMCKQFYRIDILENDNIEMTPLAKTDKIKFETSLRKIKHE